MDKLSPGKLPHDFMDELLRKYTRSDERVLVGAQIGEDAAVIDIGDKYLVAKTDPITFVTDLIGYYAVHVNSNDIACMGATPKWFMASVLLPEKDTDRALVKQIFAQIDKVCKKQNIVYCGGHTEVTLGLARPIVVGHMLGEAAKKDLVIKRNSQVGDRIILVREIPIEATAIIAQELGNALVEQYSVDFVDRCRQLLMKPGISVVPLCRIAMKAGEVHAMHDPTEGGVAMALHELAAAAELGLEIDASAVPVLPEGKLLCDHFGLDPLGCISSGSLLVVSPEKSALKIMTAYKDQDITAADIGVIKSKEYGTWMVTEAGREVVPRFYRDEIIDVIG